MVEHLLILCTCPTVEEANRLAHLLIEQQLAACVNILPQLTSVYKWQGQIETQTETLLLIKSLKTLYAPLEECLKKEHPYDTPEIIAFTIQAGSANYLQWIQNTLLP